MPGKRTAAVLTQGSRSLKKTYPEIVSRIQNDLIYWCETGKHQEKSDRLFKKLIPDIGNAATSEGELLRLVTNLYYQLYNNGMSFEKFIEDKLFNAYKLGKPELEFFTKLREELRLDDSKYQHLKDLEILYEILVDRTLEFIQE